MSTFASIADNLRSNVANAASTVYSDASDVAKNAKINPIPALVITSIVASIMFIIMFIAIYALPNYRLPALFGGILVVSLFSYAIFSLVLHITFMIDNPAIAGSTYAISMGKSALY